MRGVKNTRRFRVTTARRRRRMTRPNGGSHDLWQPRRKIHAEYEKRQIIPLAVASSRKKSPAKSHDYEYDEERPGQDGGQRAEGAEPAKCPIPWTHEVERSPRVHARELARRWRRRA